MSTTAIPEAILVGKGLRMAFGGVEVVRGVDIELHAGEVHAIVGENGAGKSTVAKLLAGVHRPAGGEILVNGRAVHFENPRHAISMGIGLIHQEPLTFPDLDVAENIFVGHPPTVRGAVSWSEMRRRAADILAGLQVSLDPTARVGGLSVADQQMVELAAALSHEARVLLMDETTASLTPKEVAELFAIVRRLRDQGCAIAFVSHHLEEIFEIADRITVLRDGEKVGERRPAETSIPEIVRLMVGRDTNLAVHSPAAASGEAPILEVSNLSGPGFHDVSFEVRPGTIVGLGGLVGAGRTEVLNALFGIHRATGGTIKVDGTATVIARPRHAIRHGIALVPEDRQHDGLLLSMPIVDNAVLPSIGRLARFGWRRRRAEHEAARANVESLNVKCRSIHQPIRELSGGNQQKVVLAKWLLIEPRILLLDEPTRGVDVGAKEEVHRQIRELVSRGMAILMVSSDLPELLALSDRILVMREGRLVREFARDAATPESVMLAATGQEAHVGR